MPSLVQESLLQGAPLNRGHDHAANASVFRAQGAWDAAAAEEEKAADAFLKCKQYSTDVGMQNTLQRMHDDHRHRAREATERANLERKRAARQPNTLDTTSPTNQSNVPLSPLDRFRKQSREMAATLAQDHTSLASGSNSPLTPINQRPYPQYTPAPGLGLALGNDDSAINLQTSSSQAMSGASSPTYTQATSTPLYDSQTTVGGSYMVLGGRSDPNDPFNHFWKILNEMLENLSQPVAWATVPLSSSGIANTVRSDTSSSESGIDSRKRESSKGQEKKSDIEFSDDDTSGSDSFYLVDASDDDSPSLSRSISPTRPTFPPTQASRSSNSITPNASRANVISSKSSPVTKNATNELVEENTRLRLEVENLRNTLEQTSKAVQERLEQEQVLRDSIMLVKRQAQRAMQSSISMNRPLPPTPQGAPHSSPASNPPPVPPKPFMPTPSPPAASPFIAHPGIPVRQASPLTIPNINNNPLLNLPTLPAIPMLDQTPNATMQKRIKQLEEELKLAKVENEKQKAQIAKFRERWEKLKESAKRKRSAREAANVIPEEDEGSLSANEKGKAST